MSTQHPGSTPERRDPDLAGAEAAMHRAAKRARRRAEEAAKDAGGRDQPAETSGGIRKVRNPRQLISR